MTNNSHTHPLGGERNRLKRPVPTALDAAEAQEAARQAEVELSVLLGIEESLRIALQWMMRGRGNSYKLSTLHAESQTFEEQLTRLEVLADRGGYMHLITGANPHSAGEVEALRNERADLHANLEGIIVRLDHVSRDDASEFGKICADLERFLDDLRAHGRKEGELRRRSSSQQEGESG